MPEPVTIVTRGEEIIVQVAGDPVMAMDTTNAARLIVALEAAIRKAERE